MKRAARENEERLGARESPEVSPNEASGAGTKRARFESRQPAVRVGDPGPLAELLSLPDLVLASLVSAWLGWGGALALRAVSRDACALVASHHRMLRWLLSDVLPPVMACSTDRVAFPTDSPRAALSLLAAPCGDLFARPDLEMVSKQWFAGPEQQQQKERSQCDDEAKGENESEGEGEGGRRADKEAAVKQLDGVLAGIEAVLHQRRIEQVSFWKSFDTTGPARSMTAQDIAEFIKQHVRVQSYVRVWKSWIRLVECDLELTITRGETPEKHVLRIVEYNSGQYYEEDEQLLWSHYSGIFHTSPTEAVRIYFQERAPGQMDEEWCLPSAFRALADQLRLNCAAQELLAVLLQSAQCELPDGEVEQTTQQESSLGEKRLHDELLMKAGGVAAACGDAAAGAISRASEPQLAELYSLVERWKYRVGRSQVYLAAGMFGMTNVLRVVPHIGSGRASAAMLQAPEGDVLTNCEAVINLAVPRTDGEFLEVHCDFDTTAREADYARVVVKIRASSRAMAERFDVSDTQPFFVYWSNPQLEEGERDDEELPPTLCRTQTLLELARAFGIPTRSSPPAGDHDHHQDDDDDDEGDHNDDDGGGEVALAREMAALLVVCACAPAAPLRFFSNPAMAMVHPVVVAVAKAFGGEEQDDDDDDDDEAKLEGEEEGDEEEGLMVGVRHC